MKYSKNSFNIEEPVSKLMMEIVKDYEIDLIIIGSKGQTTASLALLDTLKLLKGNELVPMLIVKKKGENLDLLEALKRI